MRLAPSTQQGKNFGGEDPTDAGSKVDARVRVRVWIPVGVRASGQCRACNIHGNLLRLGLRIWLTTLLVPNSYFEKEERIEPCH